MHNGEAIGRVHTQKVLGIHFDENLSWLYHVNRNSVFLRNTLNVYVNLNVLHSIKSVNVYFLINVPN